MIVVGGASVGDVQYELIGKQFECMAGYLSWNLKFSKSYSATAACDLEKNADAIAELKALAAAL